METKVHRTGTDAKWRTVANSEEKQRLKVIAERRARKTQTDRELAAEERLIMRRCIKRLRRKNGKS